MLTMRLLVAPMSLLALRATGISAAEPMIAYQMTVIDGDGGHPLAFASRCNRPSFIQRI